MKRLLVNKNKYFTTICLLAGVFVLTWAGINSFNYLTDGFSISSITHPFPNEKKWQNKPPTKEVSRKIEGILSQPFRYIGKGAQSYAFATEDGKYVLKFFKFKHLVMPTWMKWLPSVGSLSTYKQAYAKKKQKRFHQVFDGYKLAWDVNREDSGLIYAKLDTISKRWPKVQLKDKLGRTFMLDLNTVVFVIQEKAVKTREEIRTALCRGDTKQAIDTIEKVFDLYVKEYQKGVHDLDYGVMHNTGFVGDRPIHLDVGKLQRSQHICLAKEHEKDLVIVAWKFDSWIRENYRDLSLKLRRLMEEKLTKVYGHAISIPEEDPRPSKTSRKG